MELSSKKKTSSMIVWALFDSGNGSYTKGVKKLDKDIRDIKGCDKKKANKTQNAINQCYLEKAALTPLKAIQMEGVLSRELFSKIVDCVFNHYEWPERLDDEIGRIILKYRKKGELGRNKITVRKALYKAYALGV